MKSPQQENISCPDLNHGHVDHIENGGLREVRFSTVARPLASFFLFFVFFSSP